MTARKPKTVKRTSEKATKKGKKLQYKTIDLRTAKGFRQAEKLKAQGWKISSVGFHTIQLYKRK